MTIRVPYDDLHYTSDGIFEHAGKPFTGFGVQHDADGALVCEVPFLDGQEHGIAREYFTSGGIKCETPYFHGVIHGSKREWYENGSPKKKSDVVYGILMESIELTVNNVVVEHFVRDPEDTLAKIAESRRQRFG